MQPIDTDTGSRIQCEECCQSIQEGNQLHRAACVQQQRHLDSLETGFYRGEAVAPDSSCTGTGGTSFIGDSDGSGGGDGENVSLLAAYVLWAILGPTGLHHAYLGRPHQALGWYATGGVFGWGWLRDGWYMRRYVALARDDRTTEVTAKIRATIVDVRGGVPGMSLLRMAAMGYFGWYFGKVASCLVIFPTPTVLYGILQVMGAAAGVWLVGNMGDQTIERSVAGDGAWGTAVRLAASCLAGGALLGLPVLGGIVYATRCRRYRPSMSPSIGLFRRFGRHILSCASFTALLVLAIYNHGHIHINGSTVYAHEAIRNARNSDFWQAFDFDEFRARSQESGGADYLKQTLDVGGERAARRTLGLKPDADHSGVRAAYKKLALKFHPDKMAAAGATGAEMEEANRRFVRVQEAYEVLNKIEQRRKKTSGLQQHDEM